MLVISIFSFPTMFSTLHKTNFKFSFTFILSSSHAFNLTIRKCVKTTDFKLVQTERLCRQQFQIWQKWKKVIQTSRKHWEKEKLLVTSNFSFSHSVFKRLVQQTCKSQGLFGKGLKVALQILGRKFY